MRAIIVESGVLCPLCRGSSGDFFYDSKRQWSYGRCSVCRLVHRETGSHPSREQEKARYLTHNNDASQAGYVEFLSPAVREVSSRISVGRAGLDFGCGPGPVLARMLREAGYLMETYDPYFAPSKAALKRKYDFVTCTETVEHFREPGREFSLLARLLKSRGMLLVMTRLLAEKEDFSSWWYRQDFTHLCFYSEQTLSWIARRLNLRLEQPSPGIALFLDDDF